MNEQKDVGWKIQCYQGHYTTHWLSVVWHELCKIKKNTHNPSII